MLQKLKQVLGKKLVAKCGHETKLKDKVTAFNQTIKTKIRPNEDGSVDYCHTCLGKMAIACAWCEKPIFIGDVVTLYSSDNNEEFNIPESAIIYDKECMSFVGCGRTTCADTGADYAGFWIPDENEKGKVHRKYRKRLNGASYGHNASTKSRSSVCNREPCRNTCLHCGVEWRALLSSILPCFEVQCRKCDWAFADCHWCRPCHVPNKTSRGLNHNMSSN